MSVIDPTVRTPSFFERARKFVVSASSVVVAVATVVGDVAADSDLSTVGGVVSALVLVAGSLGVYRSTNAPPQVQ
jgi:hypothetical protein